MRTVHEADKRASQTGVCATLRLWWYIHIPPRVMISRSSFLGFPLNHSLYCDNSMKVIVIHQSNTQSINQSPSYCELLKDIHCTRCRVYTEYSLYLSVCLSVCSSLSLSLSLHAVSLCVCVVHCVPVIERKVSN